MVKELIFESLLDESVTAHGHLCPGQVLGVRMSIQGLRSVGIEDPKGKDKKNIVVFVEMDRCATDAIQSVTGCSLGRRTMKFMDYGKMAATFMNLKTGRAVRVSAKEETRQKARDCFPAVMDKYKAQVDAYKVMSEEELFDVTEVKVSLRREDMPGRPLQRVQCDACKEYIQDAREIRRNGDVLCKACAGESYYTFPMSPAGEDFLLPGVMRKSHNAMEIRSKLWIEMGSEPVFGRGRRQLLQAIDTYGSINRGAKEINISYRKAWSYIKAMEERLGVKFVERKSGGKNGGGASLTEEARAFLKRYKELEEGIRDIVDERFKGIFGAGR